MNGRRGIDKSERIHTPSERAKLAAKRAKVLKEAQDPSQLQPPKLNSSGQLVTEEVVKRISGSVESKDIILGDFKSGKDDGLIHVQYAALTQRGYYPDNPHKENQDSYFIKDEKFGSGEGDAFFAVFDGHGDTGHDCAIFAKQKLHAYLAQGIKKQRAGLNAARLKELSKKGQKPDKDAFKPSSWPYLDVKEYEKCCRVAHLQCNKAMHDDKMVSLCICIWYQFAVINCSHHNAHTSLSHSGQRFNEWYYCHLRWVSCWKDDSIKRW